MIVQRALVEERRKPQRVASECFGGWKQHACMSYYNPRGPREPECEDNSLIPRRVVRRTFYFYFYLFNEKKKKKLWPPVHSQLCVRVVAGSSELLLTFTRRVISSRERAGAPPNLDLRNTRARNNVYCNQRKFIRNAERKLIRLMIE